MRRVLWIIFSLYITLSATLQGHALEPSVSNTTLRLADLARVWGTIKFFHPHVGLDSKKIDWDQALVDAIPKVKKSAHDRTAFVQALVEMVGTLNDPATLVVDMAGVTGLTSLYIPPPVGIRQPYVKWIPVKPTTYSKIDSIAHVVLTNYRQFTLDKQDSAYYRSDDQLDTLFNHVLEQIKERDTLKGVIFDMRHLPPIPGENKATGEDYALTDWKNYALRMMTFFPTFLNPNDELESVRVLSYVYWGYPSQNSEYLRFPSSITYIPPYFSAWLTKTGLNIPGRQINPATKTIQMPITGPWIAPGFPLEKWKGKKIGKLFGVDQTVKVSYDPLPPAPHVEDMVFLMNQGTKGLVYMLSALKSKGATVIQRGPARYHEDLNTFRLKLNDQVDVIIRTSEYIDAEGVLGFIPDQVDTVIYAGLPKNQMAIAQAVNGLIGGYKSLSSSQTSIRLTNPPMDKRYPKMTHPSSAYRLLGLFRLWNAIYYFYPYKNLMTSKTPSDGDVWDNVLLEFIPIFDKAEKDALDYMTAIARLATRLQDSHTVVEQNNGYANPYLLDIFGINVPPIYVRFMQGDSVAVDLSSSVDVVIVQVYPGFQDKLTVGDVLLKINGESVQDRIQELQELIPASTDQAFMQIARKPVTWSHQDSIMLTLRDTTQVSRTRDVLVPWKIEQSELSWTFPVIPKKGFGYLATDSLGTHIDRSPSGKSDRIGYVNLVPNRDAKFKATPDWVDDAIDSLIDTRGIIFDLRGYNMNGVGATIAERIIPADSTIIAALLEIPQVFSPDQNIQEQHMGLQPTISGNLEDMYTGEVVVLIDSRAISASEQICLYLSAAGKINKKVKFIGSPTSGADGNTTAAVLPGDIYIPFTGMKVRHGNGDQLQRVGIIPDIWVTPKIDDFKQRKDGVLIRAIRYLTTGEYLTKEQ